MGCRYCQRKRPWGGRAAGWAVAVILILGCGAGRASDWPTYQGDRARSGVAHDGLGLPLYEHWVYHAALAPKPAWPPPAERDIWHELRKLHPRVTFDRAYHAVVADELAFFGSSADDAIRALDAGSGSVRWAFFTDGPVRLAPTVAGGRVYAGSDDGCVYCLSAADGGLIWKQRIAPEGRWVPGNGRLISLFPVRTGVLIDGGIAYCGAGIYPGQGVYLCALDAASGDIQWRVQAHEVSPQGYLVASDERLYVPTGRTSPAVFTRSNGELLGQLSGGGGSYALLTEGMLVSSDSRQGDELRISSPDSAEQITTFDGLRMIVDGGVAYLHRKTGISAFDRIRYMSLATERKAKQTKRDEIEKRLKVGQASPGQKEEAAALEQEIQSLEKEMRACFLWDRPCDCPYALVKAGDFLFAGGEERVVAIAAADGSEHWAAGVDGKAYGLCVAENRILVSTDRGTIHCFGPEPVERERVVKAHAEPSPYPEDGLSAAYASAAEKIVATAWPAGHPRKGYGLVLDCGEGRLAYELAARSELTLVGFERDPGKVARARKYLASAGLYGSRITVHKGTPADLRCGNLIANVVVSDAAVGAGELPSPGDLERYLRPYGGVLVIGEPDVKDGVVLKRAALRAWAERSGLSDWALDTEGGHWIVARRGALAGAGEWTHLYADPANTSCSNDAVEGPLAVQWFGEPGPRRIVDRHHRPMASLVKDGRVFVPANDTILALDAFNGALLWELEVPNSRRVGAMKDSGQMLIEGETLYIAVGNECWAIEAATGVRKAVLRGPMEGPREWGYIGCVGDRLFGSEQKVGASFRRLALETVGTLEGDFRLVVISESVFAMNRHDGSLEWAYRDGAIMNSTIAVSGGRVFFLESRGPTAMENVEGRIRIDTFCKEGTFLVALDSSSGAKLWERPVALPFHHILFLCEAEGTVVASGSYNEGDGVRYGIRTFHADSGAPKWGADFVAVDIQGTAPAKQGGSHGEQWQHPNIIGRTVYLRPYAYDLDSGEKQPYQLFRGGHGCGGLTASAHYLFGRGSNPRMYPVGVENTEGIRITEVTRPGCWLNILPACGLVLIPESSSGCTCAYSVQTSLAFIPKALSGAPPPGG